MKLKERIAKKLQTHRPGEMADGHDMELFQLRTIKNKQHLDVLEDAEMMGEGLSDEEHEASPQEGSVCHDFIILHVIVFCRIGRREC